MNRSIRSVLAFVLLMASVQPFGTRSLALTQQQETKIRIGTAEVALDVIVRDKKGRPVKDLTASEIEVYEDGVRQQIESFRLVEREPGRVSPSSNGTDPVSPAAAPSDGANRAASNTNLGTTPGVIALVFDRLTPEARALARKAGTAYADEALMSNDFTGVFALDVSLITLQHYTDNPQLVKQAIERATSRSSSSYSSSNEQVRSLAGRNAALDRQAAAAQGAATEAGSARDSAGAAAAGQAAGQAIVEQAFLQMQMQMSETFETLERNQQGYATINGLLALINSMRNLPGRKSVLFFSEGLALPPPVVEQFKSVINTANRANVSVYAVDAAGLRIDSPSAEATREINSLAERRMNQVHRSQDPSGPLMKGLERNEDLLRLNPHSGLSDLADQTGGFLIHDTNDLSAGLRRIDEDMRVHYLVTYVPKNQAYDGRFRQISLKLARANVDFQTRKGYYAVDNSIASPVLTYEAPALAALGLGRSKNEFVTRLGALSFPEPARPGLTSILVEAPAEAITLNADNEKKVYQADFCVLVLIKNDSRQVVEKLSQHYPLSGPLDKIEAARKGEILFYREALLPPGRYTIEAVAYDALSGKASVRTTGVEVVGGNDAKLQMSSLVLLKRADRLSAEEKKKEHPLHFGEVVVYPNLGEPLRKSVSKQLAFFFTAWPAKGMNQKPRLTVEVLQGKRSLAVIPGDALEPDSFGVIKHASALPISDLPPGDYELRVLLKDGQSTVSRSAAFRIEM